MSKPLVVSIPHQLGKDEAIRRLKGGLGHLKEKTDGKLAAVEDSWSDNRADFRLAVLGQTASGNLEVLEEFGAARGAAAVAPRDGRREGAAADREAGPPHAGEEVVSATSADRGRRAGRRRAG